MKWVIYMIGGAALLGMVNFVWAEMAESDSVSTKETAAAMDSQVNASDQATTNIPQVQDTTADTDNTDNNTDMSIVDSNGNLSIQTSDDGTPKGQMKPNIPPVTINVPGMMSKPGAQVPAPATPTSANQQVPAPAAPASAAPASANQQVPAPAAAPVTTSNIAPQTESTVNTMPSDNTAATTSQDASMTPDAQTDKSTKSDQMNDTNTMQNTTESEQ